MKKINRLGSWRTRNHPLTQVVLTLAAFAVSVAAQSGGTFTITQSVVASGGGQSSGGTYNVTGTLGQHAAGTNMGGGQFALIGGFWEKSPASIVSVSGHVLIVGGRGVRNAIVTLTDPQNVMRFAITRSQGSYSFSNVVAGQTYTIAVRSKRFQFTSRIITVTDDLAGIDFIAH